MNIKVLVVVLCVVVFTLAIWNNARYSRANQELESIKKEQDSICLMRNESILYTIQTNAQTIDSLVQGHKSVDSTYLKNQELILKQMLNSFLNESKQDATLKDWVKDNIISLENQLIPTGVSLDVSDFKLFVEERKKLLAKRLKKIIEGV